MKIFCFKLQIIARQIFNRFRNRLNSQGGTNFGVEPNTLNVQSVSNFEGVERIIFIIEEKLLGKLCASKISNRISNRLGGRSNIQAHISKKNSIEIYASEF